MHDAAVRFSATLGVHTIHFPTGSIHSTASRTPGFPAQPPYAIDRCDMYHLPFYAKQIHKQRNA